MKKSLKDNTFYTNEILTIESHFHHLHSRNMGDFSIASIELNVRVDDVHIADFEIFKPVHMQGEVFKQLILNVLKFKLGVSKYYRAW